MTGHVEQDMPPRGRKPESDRSDRGDPTGITKYLRSLREKAGLTQEQVADRLNLERSTIARFEGGWHDPKMSTILSYAKAIGAHVSIQLEKTK